MQAAEKTVGTFQALKEKIEAKTARVGVVGLGYVGLPLAMEFAKAGFTSPASTCKSLRWTG